VNTYLHGNNEGVEDEQQELQPEENEEDEPQAAVLPAREAISLITPDAATPDEDTPDPLT
jgi:hypothetical protein